jgi:hypothetical protein
MVAASTDSTTVRAARQAVLNPSMLAAGAAGTACVLIAGGCAALAVQAGVGQHASALWMSALAVATMMGAPLLMARSSGRYITLKSAATLIATISAMNAVPGYLKDFQHASVVAASMILTGGVLLCCWRRLVRRDVSLLHHVEPTSAVIRSNGSAVLPALLALLAGLSSGSLARFQLFTLCGANGAQPFWQIALLFITVCALAWAADRSRGNGNSMLMVLYVARAALTGVLASADNPALAPLAAKIFLLLDCLTIPALANLRGNAKSALSTTCPGIAHHIGMMTGAALSTSRYFFGDGFVLLFALSAAANLICAASLATHWLGGNASRPYVNRYHHQARSSG